MTVIDTLREEHQNMTRLLNALEHQMTVFESAGKPDYDVIRGIADYFLDYPDSCHHPKEDVVLAHLQAHYPRDAAAVEDLLNEHRQLHERARWFSDAVHALLNESDIARDAVVNAARVFVETERRHMAKEEERFFPLIERNFTPKDWSEIAGEVTRVCDPLFGDRVEDEFRSLRDRLLAWEEEYRMA